MQDRYQSCLISINAFCEQYGIGRTKAYEEIKAGRLIVRKVGKRTLVQAGEAVDAGPGANAKVSYPTTSEEATISDTVAAADRPGGHRI